jgi:hypothetical protein
MLMAACTMQARPRPISTHPATINAYASIGGNAPETKTNAKPPASRHDSRNTIESHLR